MSKEIFTRFDKVVPIGSAICTDCRKLFYQKENTTQKSTSVTASTSSDVTQQTSCSATQMPLAEQETSESFIEFTTETASLDFQSTPFVQASSSRTTSSKSSSSQQPDHYVTQTTMERLQTSSSSSSTTEEDTQTVAVSFTEVAPSSIPDIEERASSQSSQSSSSIPEQEISIWQDEKEQQNVRRSTLNSAHSTLSDGRVSPLQSTLNTDWDDISVTQQRYYLRKAKELVQSTLSVISPGQEDQIWKSLRQQPHLMQTQDPTKPKRFDIESVLLDGLVKAHSEMQTWQSKRQILSLFANDFSRDELQTILPGIAKWQIDAAREHATNSGKGQPIPEKQIFRTRIDDEKVDHFLDFVSRPEYLQEVAYGTKTMRLDTGERITIPAVVRTVIPTRIIEQYLAYCKQQQFQPAGQRSLYRILEVCSASMQKSLKGLDNVTAEGTEAIDSLNDVVQALADNGVENTWQKDIQNQLKEVKRYLKTDFKTHVEREAHCEDHCCTYALSDPKKVEYQSKCSHIHDTGCDRCDEIDFCLQKLEAKIQSTQMDEEQRSRLNFEFNQCAAAIRSWKSHLLRTVVQEQAKQDVMKVLDKESCLVIVDWAMKFLPIKYRESMSEFFGKRGLSWHVSAVVTKREEKYDVECYVHICFNSCTQNNYAVASILDHLFKTIKSEYPAINKAYLRSDNAGCYHNGPLILYLSEIGTRTGISLERYDFSDPQAGKDICDRKTAPMKAHIRRYVNEKNDVTTAEDMKTAIESHGGLKGCRIAVVELDSSKDLPEDNKIPGISLLYNFLYEANGVRTWKAYDVGKGLLLPYREFVRGQSIEGLKETLPFSARNRQLGTVHSSSSTRSHQNLFGCNEPACVLTFKTEEEAQRHMDTGRHNFELESLSVYDKARMKWAEKVTGISGALERPTTSSTEGDIAVHTSPQRSSKMGWALKISAERKRFETKVRDFLVEKFEDGEKRGTKADPLSVSREMKTKRDENGHLFFQPDEWKTAQQIKSFFSRYNAKVREMRNASHSPQDMHLGDEDIEVLEDQINRFDLRNAIASEIRKPEHPIVVDDTNICQLANEGKLLGLKLVELKSLCKSLDLKIKGSAAKKKSFVDCLISLVKSCSCNA